MVIALAFVPIEHVATALKDLEDYLTESDEERPDLLLEFVERKYVGRRRRQGRAQSPFKFITLVQCVLANP